MSPRRQRARRRGPQRPNRRPHLQSRCPTTPSTASLRCSSRRRWRIRKQTVLAITCPRWPLPPRSQRRNQYLSVDSPRPSNEQAPRIDVRIPWRVSRRESSVFENSLSLRYCETRRYRQHRRTPIRTSGQVFRRNRDHRTPRQYPFDHLRRNRSNAAVTCTAVSPPAPFYLHEQRRGLEPWHCICSFFGEWPYIIFRHLPLEMTSAELRSASAFLAAASWKYALE